MIKLFDACNFPETWTELSKSMAPLDKNPNLSLKIFTELAEEQAATLNSDCLPFMVAHFMVRVQVIMSYTNVMAARVGFVLNEQSKDMDTLRARKAAALNGLEDKALRPKSDAALERQLTIDPDLIELKWSIEDLKVAHQFCGDTFRTLQKGAEAWRARYYGAGADKNLTSGVNDSEEGATDVGGFQPVRMGG